MFIKSIKVAALAAMPVVTLLGGVPAKAQDIGVVLNSFCIDLFASNQQPRVPFTTRDSSDPMHTILTTPPPVFPEADTFGPNPTNLIPTKYEDAETCRGTPIPNTLPSTPENPYNLHDDPTIRQIDKTSPTDDLDWIMDKLEAMSRPHRICRNWRGYRHCYEYPRRVNTRKARRLARRAVDIIEGNDLRGRFRDREYEGFPILHYLGGLKTKTVPADTKRLVVNQIWYDSHIESDTNYVDTTAVQDDEWEVEYRVKILNRGHEDFAPYAMFFDDPLELDLSDVGGPDMTAGGTKTPRVMNIGIDQTFFPMEEGEEYTLILRQPPARFWNLTYHWGWRVHPPRVQVMENRNVPLANGTPRNSAEVGVFGENPRESEEAKLAAIGMIGDTAPAKRLWRMFRELADMPNNSHGYGNYYGFGGYYGYGMGRDLRTKLPLIRQAFYDWQNRNQLPTGYEMADGADMTILFLNNTIYGEVRGHDGDAQVALTDEMYSKRGDSVEVQLLNGDYYVHAYVLVDFGGLRGWENTFHNTLAIGGAGPLFTFGRNYFWIHVAGNGGPIPVPPAVRPEEPVVTPHSTDGYTYGYNYMRGYGDNGDGAGDDMLGSWGGMMQPVDSYTSADGIGEHMLTVNFTYEPSRRIRMYQFDALHHDIAVWSVH
jgi:hypothetical protein